MKKSELKKIIRETIANEIKNLDPDKRLHCCCDGVHSMCKGFATCADCCKQIGSSEGGGCPGRPSVEVTIVNKNKSQHSVFRYKNKKIR